MIGNLRDLSLKWKLSLLTTSVTALVLITCGMFFYVSELSSMREVLLRDYSLTAEMTALHSTAALAFNDQKDAEETLATLRVRPSVLNCALYNQSGQLFAAYQQPGAALPPKRAPPEAKATITDTGVEVVQPVIQGDTRVGTLYLRADLRLLYERLRTHVFVIVSVVALGTIASLVISTQMQRLVSAPIYELTEAARSVSASRDYNIRAAKHGNDEIGHLIDQFNDMLTQIQHRDIALKSAQEDLEHKVEVRTRELRQANQELESFSYSVSHDLRAPLRHISGFVELLEHSLQGKIDAEAREYLVDIKSSVKESGRLIDDLLAFSRMARADMQRMRFNMGELVGEVCAEIVQETPDQKIEWQVAPLPVVEGDLSMLRQTWRNLISNAVKYSSKRDVSRIEIGSHESASELIFWIRDNGVGFDMKYVDRLFGVFHRLHGAAFEGTGIGLANVRRIVMRHGGRTWAEGKLNEGATFYFSLPKEQKGSHARS